MVKYSIEELIQLKPSETLAVTSFDHVEFRSIIEKVKELQKLKEEEFLSHHGNRRRSSHHHMRPKVKHNKPKVKTDADGWSTLEPAAPTGSGDDEPTAPAKNGATQETVRVKPNNKNISSSRPADNSDIIADKQTHGFNAFAALEDEESD
ncbi:Cap-associated protein CAF20 [Nakaseomyces bracarensis]|uniref:Cap-associated protein CAF20 n=1 Tax=Nakaseomyces bracarensis TaxID=273131 RepID=A0ABR4NXE1_9SACH